MARPLGPGFAVPSVPKGEMEGDWNRNSIGNVVAVVARGDVEVVRAEETAGARDVTAIALAHPSETQSGRKGPRGAIWMGPDDVTLLLGRAYTIFA